MTDGSGGVDGYGWRFTRSKFDPLPGIGRIKDNAPPKEVVKSRHHSAYATWHLHTQDCVEHLEIPKGAHGPVTQQMGDRHKFTTLPGRGPSKTTLRPVAGTSNMTERTEATPPTPIRGQGLDRHGS